MTNVKFKLHRQIDAFLSRKKTKTVALRDTKSAELFLFFMNTVLDNRSAQ
jgi:hypothetical protein